MKREIWLSPVLGNKRADLIALCAEHLKSRDSNRLLYIAASHPLLDLVTDKLLDGENTRGLWGDFPVYLFHGLVRRILAEARIAETPTANAEPSVTAGLLPGNSAFAQGIAIDREELPLRKSLLSQIIKQLNASGKLTAIKPLANRDGCVNTIASLIGELQRAGKTAAEFEMAIAARNEELDTGSKKTTQNPRVKIQDSSKRNSQSDFDREVALIYRKYSDALQLHGLTDEDADQLRALQIVRGKIGMHEVTVPWLDQIELLVLDGFFDFTPVQGEILKYLIPRVPNVIVSLNQDEQNAEIFRPFASTVERLQSIAEFAIKETPSTISDESPAQLRRKLFNASVETEPAAETSATSNSRYTLMECSDRELEVRSIAKEIKRLIIAGQYQLSDIGLVVRERAAYADTIARVFANEAIPCNLVRRIETNDVPAIRACGKLFQLLQSVNEDLANPAASELAQLIKTDYFRPANESLKEIATQFDSKYSLLLDDGGAASGANDKLRAALGIGRWKPDDLENVIAYVGSELHVNAWIERARKLIRIFPSAEAAQSLLAGSEAEDPAATAEDEQAQEDEAVMDRRQRPAPIHPAAIAWTILIMRHLQRLIGSLPEEGTLEELQRAVMLLLDQLQFSNQINEPFEQQGGASDIPQATLDVRGRESLRRAIAAAVRSFRYAQSVVSEPPVMSDARRITLSSFIDEVDRCLKFQTLSIGAANRDGLRVLEATDVRGLRFRVIFIAGMIEGGFPLRTSGDWLYPQEERLRLQKHGIFLEDISTDTLLKEEHYFYQVACRATERLYMTRPLALNDGTETVASYYIEELRRAVAPEPIQVQQIRGDLDARDPFAVSSAAELGTVIVRAAKAKLHRREPPADGARLLSLAERDGYVSSSAIKRIEIEQARHGEWFGPYDGEITNDDLRQMLAQHFGPAHVYSASRLSTYGNCAFRFFGNRVLRIEPRSEAALDLQAIDAGKLLHDILRRFFEKHRGDYLPARDRDELRSELARTADEVFREHEDKVPPLNDRIWKIDCEIRKLILDQVLLYELKLQEKTEGRVLPGYFELAFGRTSDASDPKSTKQYLKFERAEDTALIQGQIDRVDIDEAEELAIAYDYKLSKGATLDDIRSGRQVQIPIYLAALEQLFLKDFDLGGGGYYTLRARGGRLNQGLYRAAHADCTDVRSHRSKFDDIEWVRIRQEVVARVWQFIDGMRGGHFRVKPSLGRHTCKFCDYSAVCRFDAYRINRKK